MDYSKVIAEGRLERILEIAEKAINGRQCKVIRDPAPGMVMVKLIDPIEQTPFYLGEAFVTECEVEMDGKTGYGCVLGDAPERALCGAILDAGIGGCEELSDDVTRMLCEEEHYIHDKWTREIMQVARTKVNFDVKKG